MMPQPKENSAGDGRTSSGAWDPAAFDALHAEIEAEFKKVCAESSPELPAARPFRGEFYAKRLEFIKSVGRSRLFHNLPQAREIVESFRRFLAEYASRVQAEVTKSLCPHGRQRELCDDCAGEDSYAQAVHEGRV
jgi:hypothetical protein